MTKNRSNPPGTLVPSLIYRDIGATDQQTRRILTRLQQIPGVEAGGAGSNLPTGSRLTARRCGLESGATVCVFDDDSHDGHKRPPQVGPTALEDGARDGHVGELLLLALERPRSR